MPSDAGTGYENADAIDARRLLIFREVARRGSLSAAAAALGWTQPAVGQHLQRLERELGLSLARRSTRGVALTEAGTRLLAHADAVAARLDAARQEMTALRTLRSGRLRIGAFPSACATFVPAVLARLALTAPDIEVRLTELAPPEARSAVLVADLDIAILFKHAGSEESDDHPDLISHALFDDPVHAVVPARHPLTRSRQPIALHKLADEPWIAGCVRCRTHLQDLARAAGFVPDIRHITDDYVVVQTLVAERLGVALLPELALNAAANAGVVRLAISGRPARQISLVHRLEAATVPAAAAGIRAFTQAVAPETEIPR
ncbi:MAG TPA: LysR substrate-binding domain-containing protein [Jatrophihabitantaceae bacterium]|nr:LysR substrate-binding domain-containing protein [Jatrophihabitantaceae bacterium]